MQPKSPALASLLGFFLGPLGLFYVSVSWALASGLALIVLGAATGGVGCLGWFACALAGWLLAEEHNRKLSLEPVLAAEPLLAVPVAAPAQRPVPPPPLPARAVSAPPRLASEPPRPGSSPGAPPPSGVTHVVFAAGTQIDRYVVESELGAGGMARVFKVRHAFLGSHHALKVLSSDLVGSEDLRQRFLAEGRVQARLKHPNIVPVTDVVALPGVAGLVMDYVEGDSLEDVLRARARPPEEAWIRDVFRQVLAGVGFAHAQGVIHRDLKPANVFVERGAPLKVRLLDFGIAKIVGDEGRGRTRTGMQMGTPHYMSPEQIRLGAAAVTVRSDIFSLGVTLYELATGELPFDGTTDFDVQLRITQGGHPPVRERRPDLSDALVRAIDIALNPDPAGRFGSCEEFSEALV